MPSKILLYSNYFSPYRVALWSSISDHLPLEVRLASDGDGGRGWDLSEMLAISGLVKSCNLRSLNWPVDEFWIPNKSWLDISGVDGIILGGWETPAYWLLALKAKRAGIRTVGFYESTLETQKFISGPIAKIRAAFYASLDAVVTPGTAATEALLDMDVKPKNIFQGFNVVDHSYWHKNVNIGRAQQVAQSGHSYLYVGQLIERKGVADLIMAFKECRRPYDTLRIVGKGPLHSHLQNLVDSWGMQGSITLVGAKSGLHLASEYAVAQTLVLPSHKEVWGLVVNEALASGLHVVAGEKCGVVRDVRNMDGVFAYEEAQENRKDAIANQMIFSREAWAGWIAQPEILLKTPEDFAVVFEKAVQQT